MRCVSATFADNPLRQRTLQHSGWRDRGSRLTA